MAPSARSGQLHAAGPSNVSMNSDKSPSFRSLKTASEEFQLDISALAVEVKKSADDGHSSKHLLDDIPDNRKVDVVWHGLDAFVPIINTHPTFRDRIKASFPCWPQSRRSSSQRQVLYKVKGVCKRGQVMALMGPSGSGKTSLLSVIGGRTPKLMQTSGKVLFGGRTLSRQVKRNIGYVMQDDILFDALTVEETLLYAARLRMSRNMPLQGKKQRVDAVIAALGLEKCRDSLIGSQQRRGVSGGERKRVSIGHELVIDPSVLLLDEPTSGLDSTTAMHLLSALRGLARGGRTIITSIHQPSSRLFQQLDLLVLLADGHIIYSGLRSEVTEWFGNLGCKLPYAVNAADFILDIASGEFDVGVSVLGTEGGEKQKAKLIEISEGFLERCEDGFQGRDDFQRLHAILADAPLELDNSTSVSSFARLLDTTERRDKQDTSNRCGSKRNVTRSGATYLEQLRVLLLRSGRARRLSSLGIERFIQYVSVGFVVGIFYWKRGKGKTLLGATDTASLVFFELVFLSFNLLFKALMTFPSEMPILLKERASGMYRLSAYYIARTSASLPLDLSYPLLLVTLAYWMGALRPEVEIFVGHCLTIILGILNAQSFGLLIGVTTKNFDQAQTSATVIVLSFMLCAGFFIQEVPGFLSWVKYLSFVYWAYSLLLKIQFKGEAYRDCRTQDSDSSNDIRNFDDCALISNVSEKIKLPRNVNGSPVMEILILILMLIVLHFATYVALWKKTRKA